jgi:hypothetical protein
VFDTCAELRALDLFERVLANFPSADSTAAAVSLKLSDCVCRLQLELSAEHRAPGAAPLPPGRAAAFLLRAFPLVVKTAARLVGALASADASAGSPSWLVTAADCVANLVRACNYALGWGNSSLPSGAAGTNDAAAAAGDADATLPHGAWDDAVLASAAAVAEAAPNAAVELVAAARDTGAAAEAQATAARADAVAHGHKKFGLEEPAPAAGPVAPLADITLECAAYTLAVLAPVADRLPADACKKLRPLTDMLYKLYAEHKNHAAYDRLAASKGLSQLALRVLATLPAESVATEFGVGLIRILSVNPRHNIVLRGLRGPRDGFSFRDPARARDLPSAPAEATAGTKASDVVLLLRLLAHDNDDVANVTGDVLRAYAEHDVGCHPFAECVPGTELLPALVNAGLFKAIAAAAPRLVAQNAQWPLSKVAADSANAVCRWLIQDPARQWEWEEAKDLTLAPVSEWSAQWAEEWVAAPLREAEAAGFKWRTLDLQGNEDRECDAVRRMLEYMTQPQKGSASQ